MREAISMQSGRAAYLARLDEEERVRHLTHRDQVLAVGVTNLVHHIRESVPLCIVEGGESTQRGPSAFHLFYQRALREAHPQSLWREGESTQRGMHQAGVALREGASHPTCASVRAESMGTLLRKCSAFDASEDAFV
jgi:hypothetical protein